MTFGSILSALVIGPLKFIFETVFQITYELVPDPGVCIIALSLVMNFLVLPLYRRADAVQEAARDREAKLAPGVAHIKKTFSGNERMMMLQTYYRQNHYSPLNAFSGSVSLLLEIPFFMAAYQFLSGLPLLTGAVFGAIRNLGAPDRLLSLGTLTVNVLPVVMTLINFASAAIYLKGFPLKTKLRTYAIAVVFLVLLYDSPAGLVFYWTLNNVFSLLKNLVLLVLVPKIKAKKAAKDAKAPAEAGKSITPRQKARLARKEARLARKEARRKKRAERAGRLPEPDPALFFISAAFLTVLTGAFIPSVFISASPQEFVDLKTYYDPLWYNASAFLLAAGSFLLWGGVFYWLARPKGKVVFERVMAVSAVLGTVNYMFFGTDLGILSASLQYEGGLSFSRNERILNGVVFFAVIAVVLLTVRKRKKILKYLLPIGAAALAVMSGINAVSAQRELKDVGQAAAAPKSYITLSRSEKNVAVLFLDRAMGEYMPYFLKERPDLKDLFDGFTWYANTVSFGGHTNMGGPAVMGGYEYTPVELNKRDTETLREKHNESLKVLPVLFLNNGYGVTVCDAPYANYKWIPDLSIYDEYPEIRKYVTKGAFGESGDRKDVIRANERHFFAFSWMKTLPLELQYFVYDNGNYLSAGGENGAGFQIRNGMSKAHGMDATFLSPFEVLVHLRDMTDITDDGKGQYLFFYNDAPHEPTLLKEPEYLPAAAIDNTEYDEAHTDRFTADGKTLTVESNTQMMHYQSNLASLLQVGNWLQYLRKSGVYDNTRIIIVSDHGFNLGHDPERLFDLGDLTVDTESYYPLLLVKDFNASGFRVSDAFMTNADVPSLAVEGVIDEPVNPFTGKRLSSAEKTAHDQFIMISEAWHVNNTDKVFDACAWAVVSKNMHDRGNWRFIEKETVLKEHRISE